MSSVRWLKVVSRILMKEVRSDVPHVLTCVDLPLLCLFVSLTRVSGRLARGCLHGTGVGCARGFLFAFGHGKSNFLVGSSVYTPRFTCFTCTKGVAPIKWTCIVVFLACCFGQLY